MAAGAQSVSQYWQDALGQELFCLLMCAVRMVVRSATYALPAK